MGKDSKLIHEYLEKAVRLWFKHKALADNFMVDFDALLEREYQRGIKDGKKLI